ncbi:MAG: hypothetical protein ACOC8E_02145, partial [Planctomycetota bacterium]
MLGGMRKILDKYQKHLLVVLAAFLMVVFIIPVRQMMQPRSSYREGTLYGVEVTRADWETFGERWATLGLGFARARGSRKGPAFDTYLLLLAARHHGVRVGPDAVTAMLRKHPPHTEEIEYVLADPDDLAGTIEPSQAELRRFHKETSERKDEPFDEVEDAVRREYQAARARELAPDLIRAARREVAAIARQGREGKSWEGALGTAAAGQDPALTHRLTRPFTEETAARALRPLTTAGPDGEPVLPDDVRETLFSIPIGEVSPVFQAGDKYYFFRVTHISAGFTAQGKLVKKDSGWLHGRYVVLREYKNYNEIVEAKLGQSTEQMRETCKEYLIVQKYVRLLCGPEQAAPLPADVSAQAVARATEETQGLMLDVGIRPFYNRTDRPAREELLDFYDRR